MRGSLRPRTPAQGLWINTHHTFQQFQALIDPRLVPTNITNSSTSMVLVCLVLSSSYLHLPTHVVARGSLCDTLYSEVFCRRLCHAWTFIVEAHGKSLNACPREQLSTGVQRQNTWNLQNEEIWRDIMRYQRPTCSQHVTTLCERCETCDEHS